MGSTTSVPAQVPSSTSMLFCSRDIKSKSQRSFCVAWVANVLTYVAWKWKHFKWSYKAPRINRACHISESQHRAWLKPLISFHALNDNRSVSIKSVQERSKSVEEMLAALFTTRQYEKLIQSRNLGKSIVAYPSNFTANITTAVQHKTEKKCAKNCHWWKNFNALTGDHCGKKCALHQTKKLFAGMWRTMLNILRSGSRKILIYSTLCPSRIGTQILALQALSYYKACLCVHTL